LHLLDIHLPSKLGQALELLEEQLRPLALFAIGGSLVGIGITAVNFKVYCWLDLMSSLCLL
jgi:hypothetical protein